MDERSLSNGHSYANGNGPGGYSDDAGQDIRPAHWWTLV
jgi:hypothetical protein